MKIKLFIQAVAVTNELSKLSKAFSSANTTAWFSSSLDLIYILNFVKKSSKDLIWSASRELLSKLSRLLIISKS
jgi:hypothetical protein